MAPSFPDAPDRWHAAKAVFEGAAALDAEARGAYLGEACGGDPALRATVEALLAADDAADAEPDGFLDAPPIALGWPSAAAGVADLSGTELGPYRVGERIGEGGMGEVFLAERADGAFRQVVALKLVKRGMDTDAVLRRFRAERRILARLEHPAIARLLDGGAAPDGRPWLAMEHVRGEPITAYAARHALPLDARLALFEEVCEAVRHAHARLVVHRDLKPSNVLVAEDDEGRAQVKLLDFGIAHVLGGDDEAEASVLTEAGVRPMTRAYAAPEQIRGEAVTTATDVYALGVLLYELVAGRRPFEEASPTALEGAILTRPPARPSAALRASAPHDRAGYRRLRGDLDTICLKALAKEPEARYASADALLADVRRHRAGLPLAARPPSVGYRVRKFAGRHPAGVAATAAAVLAVAAFASYHTHRLSAERDQARQAAAQARQAAAQAEEISATLVGLFDRDPLAADAERLDTLTVRAFLLGRGAGVLSGLRGQPALQARLLPLFSRLHVQLGSFDEARDLAARALALCDSLGLGATAEAAEAHTALATALENRGDAARAEAHYRRALALRRVLHGEDDVATAEAMNNLAVLLSAEEDRGAREEGLRLARGALATSRRLLGDEHLDVAQAHNNVGAAYYDLGAFGHAAEHYRRALAVRRRRLGDHPLVANTESNLANLLHDQGQPAEAVPLFQDAIRIWRATLRPDHPLVSTGLYGLSEALRDLGRLAEAEAAATESLAIDRASLPPDHPYVAGGLVGLGEIRSRRGRMAEAEAAFREALALYARRPDTDASDRAEAEAALGACLLRQGRPAEAAPLLRAALPHLDPAVARTARAELARAEAAGRS
jgi:serine/threonine protein kinase/tetratricopeptide (TPR) repeat protein